MLESPLKAAVTLEPAAAEAPRPRGLAISPPEHGQTTVHWCLRLPAAPAVLSGAFRLKNLRQPPSGVVTTVAVNGGEQFKRELRTASVQEVAVDLARWAGRMIVLSVMVDAQGDNTGDNVWFDRPVINLGAKSKDNTA